MRLFNQLFWIFLFVFMGELLSSLMSAYIVLPGSVIGMILMLMCLHFKLVKLEQVDQVGTWLTENMAIFFVPSGVALMTRFDLLQSIWWELIVIIVVTTVLTLIFVGLVVGRINKRTQMKIKATATLEEAGPFAQSLLETSQTKGEDDVVKSAHR